MNISIRVIFSPCRSIMVNKKSESICERIKIVSRNYELTSFVHVDRYFAHPSLYMPGRNYCQSRRTLCMLKNYHAAKKEKKMPQHTKCHKKTWKRFKKKLEKALYLKCYLSFLDDAKNLVEHRNSDRNHCPFENNPIQHNRIIWQDSVSERIKW